MLAMVQSGPRRRDGILRLFDHEPVHSRAGDSPLLGVKPATAHAIDLRQIIFDLRIGHFVQGADVHEQIELLGRQQLDLVRRQESDPG